jgi:hypothetical protein
MQTDYLLDTVPAGLEVLLAVGLEEEENEGQDSSSRKIHYSSNLREVLRAPRLRRIVDPWSPSRLE